MSSGSKQWKNIIIKKEISSINNPQQKAEKVKLGIIPIKNLENSIWIDFCSVFFNKNLEEYPKINKEKMNKRTKQ